jgi:DNA-binding IclR family transcriptional regulator
VGESESDGGLKSVASAVELLNAFADDEELGVSDVALRLGVAKSTAHRLLTTLAAGGLIEQSTSTRRYRLGLHLYELGYLAVSRLELTRVSADVMQNLRDATGWTVHLSIVRGTDSLNVERLATTRGMRAIPQTRRRWPLHATASGKALCAFDPVAREARIAAGFPALTPRTITTARQFEAELAFARKHGFARSVDELMPGLTSLAAPVTDLQGIARAAISIAGGSAEFAESGDRLARSVVAAGRRLTGLYQHPGEE